MATLRKIATIIDNNVRSGLKGISNASYSIEQLQDEVKIMRNSVIKQYAMQGLIGINDFSQTICNIPTECVDMSGDYKLGVKARKFELPKPNETFNDKGIKYIGQVDGNRRFKVYLNRSHVNNQYITWLKDQPYVWLDLGSIKDGKVSGYLFNSDISILEATGVWEDPMLACDCKEGVEIEDHEFHIPDYALQQVIDNVTYKFRDLYKANQLVPNTQSPLNATI